MILLQPDICTFSISSPNCSTDFLAWLRPKCCWSKAFIAAPLDSSWAIFSISSERGNLNIDILSLYNFKHLSTIFLLKTSTRDPVDGISPLFKASIIWKTKKNSYFRMFNQNIHQERQKDVFHNHLLHSSIDMLRCPHSYNFQAVVKIIHTRAHTRL